MNIYQIDQAILECVDAETGEILDIERLEQLQMDRDQKIENVACWYKDLVADAEKIRKEELTLADRRKVVENKADRLKKYLDDALAGQKFQTARCSITFRKTTRVEIADETELIRWAETHDHRDCVTYKAPSVNKTNLTKLLKAQVDIPGAELVEGLSMGVK